MSEIDTSIRQDMPDRRGAMLNGVLRLVAIGAMALIASPSQQPEDHRVALGNAVSATQSQPAR
ncbi:hypothetical protein ACFSZS_00775 [Seohaeicola zhoushanensis]